MLSGLFLTGQTTTKDPSDSLPIVLDPHRKNSVQGLTAGFSLFLRASFFSLGRSKNDEISSRDSAGC
jgi:hypothetical protein